MEEKGAMLLRTSVSSSSYTSGRTAVRNRNMEQEELSPRTKSFHVHVCWYESVHGVRLQSHVQAEGVEIAPPM